MFIYFVIRCVINPVCFDLIYQCLPIETESFPVNESSSSKVLVVIKGLENTWQLNGEPIKVFHTLVYLFVLLISYDIVSWPV